MQKVIVLEQGPDEVHAIIDAYRDAHKDQAGWAGLGAELSQRVGHTLSDEQGLALFLGTRSDELETVYQYKMLPHDPKRNMTQAEANAVYDLLIEIGGAAECERLSFVKHYVTDERPSSEYRFQGDLGFGGKFRYHEARAYYRVDCYREDENAERKAIIRRLNDGLMTCFARYRLGVETPLSDAALIDQLENQIKAGVPTVSNHAVNRLDWMASYPDDHFLPLSPNGSVATEEARGLLLSAREGLARREAAEGGADG